MPSASPGIMDEKQILMNRFTIAVISIFSLLSFQLKTFAQMNENNISGEYYLEGVMEVGSGIKLNADHSFEMFFSYGALDKAGSGTWKLDGTHVILDSGERPASDFKMTTSRKKGSGITIQVNDPNKMILSYMACRLSGKDFSDTLEANSEGAMHSDRRAADSIGLVHQLFSDRICYFDISKSTDNYFEFTIDPTIMNIYCNNLSLEIEDGYLQGKHPLLDPSKVYRFRKSN
jgi:hypothetical protein